MGWWKIDPDAGTGQIDCNNPPSGHQEGELINAIPGRDTTEDYYNGDGPADIMGDALDRIAEEFQRKWNRPPYLKELKACFRFVSRRFEESGIYETSDQLSVRVLREEILKLRSKYGLSNDWPLERSASEDELKRMTEEEEEAVRFLDVQKHDSELRQQLETALKDE